MTQPFCVELSLEEAQLAYSALASGIQLAHPDQRPKVAKLMEKLLSAGDADREKAAHDLFKMIASRSQKAAL